MANDDFSGNGGQSHALRDARRSLAQGANASKEAAADQLISAAERLRVEAVKSGDRTVVNQAQQLSRGLERAALYLHGHTLDQITDDATELVQAKPWQAVVIAFLVGIIFGRSFNREG
ncbi:hypothetical protein [Aggregatilinea lenta]|uniref:hypothetical protein n=1 Tax=Aggregatilinea lenta TaxID=913108 RepID=UPI000E5B931C|nr:hypothetical protein [Aggregatilinea lenta]